MLYELDVPDYILEEPEEDYEPDEDWEAEEADWMMDDEREWHRD
jgi:hypothetical protein